MRLSSCIGVMKQTRMLAMPPRAAGLLLLATGATPAHHRCGVISLSVQIAVARLAGCARNLAASLAAAASPPSRTASNCCLLKIARLRAAAAALFTTASAPTAAGPALSVLPGLRARAKPPVPTINALI